MRENENCCALLSASEVKGHPFQHLSLTGVSRDQGEQSKSSREADQGEENTCKVPGQSFAYKTIMKIARFWGLSIGTTQKDLHCGPAAPVELSFLTLVATELLTVKDNRLTCSKGAFHAVMDKEKVKL